MPASEAAWAIATRHLNLQPDGSYGNYSPVRSDAPDAVRQLAADRARLAADIDAAIKNAIAEALLERYSIIERKRR